MSTRGAAALLFGFLLALPVEAQPAAESAEALFTRARSLMKTGDCANALPLLERSHALEPTPGARFNMAICEGRLGKLTQALDHLRSVIDASAPTDDRRAHAERALRDLLPRIPRLVVELDATRYELERVRLDGEDLPALHANEPFAINPGPHELEVVLSQQTPQVRRFSVAERQMYTWSLSGTALAPTTELREPSPGPAVVNESKAADRSETRTIWTTQRTAAAALGGTSLLAFGVATGFTLSAKSIYDSSESDCEPSNVCNRDGVRTRDRAREHGRIATVAVTVGIASALAAGTLWFTGGPRSPTRPKSLRVGVRGSEWAGRANGGGIVVEGSY